MSGFDRLGFRVLTDTEIEAGVDGAVPCQEITIASGYSPFHPLTDADVETALGLELPATSMVGKGEFDYSTAVPTDQVVTITDAFVGNGELTPEARAAWDAMNQRVMDSLNRPGATRDAALRGIARYNEGQKP